MNVDLSKLTQEQKDAIASAADEVRAARRLLTKKCLALEEHLIECGLLELDRPDGAPRRDMSKP